jgi:hypothetical protein
MIYPSEYYKVMKCTRSQFSPTFKHVHIGYSPGYIQPQNLLEEVHCPAVTCGAFWE